MHVCRLQTITLKTPCARVQCCVAMGLHSVQVIMASELCAWSCG